MALVVFLRGINVGGYRTFRPSILARELAAYDVMNVGAAGTFVVRKPGTHPKFVAELRRKLQFDSEIALCDGEDLIRLEMENPFGSEAPSPHVVQFVSILSRAGRSPNRLPIVIPEVGEWFVRVMGAKDRLLFGLYRAAHEDNRLPWSDRPNFRYASDNPQLEHNTQRGTDSEGAGTRRLKD
jgi:hypothetical protein